MSAVMKEALSRRTRKLPEGNVTVAVEGAPQHVLSALREALLRGETHYTDRPGMSELRARIAETLGRSPEEVVVTAGESEARLVARLALGLDPLHREVELPEEIIIGSLDHLPGLSSFRIGYVSAPDPLARKLRSWKQALSICTASPSQRAALAALDHAS